MYDEHELFRHPIVQESVQHNARTLTNIRSLTSSLFGLTAGALRLESFYGFIFYLVGTFFVSVLVSLGPAAGKPNKFFYNQWSDLWSADVLSGVMGFVLTWTLVYNLCGT